DFHYSGLVVVGDANEDGALRGELLAGGELRFGERFAEVVGYAHDFSGRAHLGAENGVDSWELGPREDWRFHEEVAAGVEVFAALDVFGEEFAELAAGHQAGSDFGQRDAGGLRDVGDGARGSRVHFQHIDFAVGVGSVAAELRSAWTGEGGRPYVGGVGSRRSLCDAVAASTAPSAEVTMAPGACGMSSSSSSLPKRLRSSARSIDSGVVPMMFMP